MIDKGNQQVEKKKQDTITVESHSGVISPFTNKPESLLKLQNEVSEICKDAKPLRFVVSETNTDKWQCEVESIKAIDEGLLQSMPSIFSYRERKFERTDLFNAVMVIPTGIDCNIGGHAGDATPAAKLLASCCDNLIVHPNVVNASDVNEMEDNCLYVEGSTICRLLMGSISIRKVRENRILVVTESREDGDWVVNQVINSSSAALATSGIKCSKVVVLENGLSMTMDHSEAGRAIGNISKLNSLFEMLMKERGNYDAVAISSRISAADESTEDLFEKYFNSDCGPNPWGGAEAALTHSISMVFSVPSAHSPTLEELSLRNHSYGTVDPRKAAEVISTSYMFCVLKGLRRSPHIISKPTEIYDPSVIAVEDVSCLIIPDNCIGLPTIAALMQGIYVIVVKSNKNLMKGDISKLPFRTDKLLIANNYLEAVGLVQALKKGIDPASIERPLNKPLIEYY